MLVKKPVKVFMVNQLCDVCKKGYMEYIGVSYNTSGTSYEHRCNNPRCKTTMTYQTTFPHPEYEYEE